MNTQSFAVWGLRDDAFPNTPGTIESVEWFGFQGLKGKYQAQIDRSLQQSTRLCVLNRGKFGAGKTNSALYFKKTLAVMEKTGSYRRVIPIIVENPKEPRNAFNELSNSILSALKYSDIGSACIAYREALGKDKAYEQIRAASGSEDLAAALVGYDEAKALQFRSYLAGAGSVRELRDIGVARRLGTMKDRGQALVGVLHVMSNSGGPNRIVLWIDEMEDLVYFTTKNYLPYTQAIREVLDRLPEHLTVFFNFTFSEPEELASIENVLGDAIMGRIDEHIIFEPPTAEDVTDYLHDLLRHNRVGKKQSNADYPFENDAFKLLVESITGRTPRFVNKVVGKTLRKMSEKRKQIEQQPAITMTELREILPAIVAEVEETRGS